MYTMVYKYLTFFPHALTSYNIIYKYRVLLRVRRIYIYIQKIIVKSFRPRTVQIPYTYVYTHIIPEHFCTYRMC